MSSSLTIAHVDSEKGWSGGQVQVFLLMEGLRARGHRNILYCPPGSQQEQRACELGLEVCPVAMRNDLHLAAVARLRRGFREHGAQLVHLHTGRANWLGGLAARRSRLPAITTRRMDHPVQRHLVNRLVYGSFVRRAVGIAPAIARRLREGGVEPNLVRMVPSTVDADALTPQRTRAQVREAEDVPETATLILAAAHLTYRKGFDIALKAFAASREGCPDAWLWIAGDGPERASLESLARELEIVDRVQLLGRRTDMADLLNAADLFVMPSRSEGLGIAALEAMAAGLPVLASKVGGLGDAVVHGRTGMLVPPEDVSALTDALVTLLSDPAARKRLGAAGPDRIDEGFRPEQMVASYEALYREVLVESASGSSSG